MSYKDICWILQLSKTREGRFSHSKIRSESQFILSSAAFLFISLGCLSPADNVGDTFQGLSRAHRRYGHPLASVLRPECPSSLTNLHVPHLGLMLLFTLTAFYEFGVGFFLDMIFRFTGNFTTYLLKCVWICRRTVTTILCENISCSCKILWLKEHRKIEHFRSVFSNELFWIFGYRVAFFLNLGFTYLWKNIEVINHVR